MSRFESEWCLCGGWAIDAWIGHQTRPHHDIDIAIFEDGQQPLFEHLVSWTLITHDAEVDQDTKEPWNGRRLILPAHIHALPTAGDTEFEFLINERDTDNWILSREPGIAMPVDRCVRKSPWDLPTAAPELLLFYKATAYYGMEGLDLQDRPQDTVDFHTLLHLLGPEARSWLYHAIASLHPDHPWLAELDE